MRYIIGVDLGTTNSCIAYVDTDHARHPSLAVHQFKIPQLISGFRLGSLSVLPSYCYLPAADEFSDAMRLPWGGSQEYLVGRLAQELGAKVPVRLVHSAKSWLCHAAANRKDKILPEDGEATRRISPVEATAFYLRHLKEAWNFVMASQDPSADWDEQDVILTVPASFDEAARTLTVEAAQMAGYRNLTLLEEPQAAFYSWISQHETVWESQFKKGQQILVCDCGGGTTDFSLIEVAENKDKLAFQRMAVGNHLLLGGDNIDMAIAHFLEQKLRQQGNPELSSSQWWQLRHEARILKEQLWDNKENYRVYLQGKGASVVQGGIALEGDAEEIRSLILEGFFGCYPWEDALKIKRSSGFRTLGLPYEEEPSMTKHLASFLHQHSSCAPDYVLFNGGTLKPAPLQEALMRSLATWFPKAAPHILPSFSLDLAVARGAAYYGKARQGLGVRIGGGTARSYYLEVELPQAEKRQAMTLLARGSEEGESFELNETFWAQPNTPVSFRLFSSHVRLGDKQHDVVEIHPEELSLLPPIHTILRIGKASLDQKAEKIPVRLGISLTAIGTLEIWLKSLKTDHHWRLEFQLRNASGQEVVTGNQRVRSDESFDRRHLEKAEQVIAETYRGQKLKPQELLKRLEEVLEMERNQWPSSILRGLWNPLMKESGYRKVSIEHDARWWNLAGFLLRPGFGFPLDDHRVKDLWKVILGETKAFKSHPVLVQQWICYRRVAGGLNKGQQMQLVGELMGSLFPKKKGGGFKDSSESYQYSEKIRALASMELIDTSLKIQLGNLLVQRFQKNEAVAGDYWALGRLGARHLFYGSVAHVVPAKVCSEWIQSLLVTKAIDHEQGAWLLIQLGRRTDYREINLSENLLETIVQALATNSKVDDIRASLYDASPISMKEQEALLGDHLPAGLSLIS